MTVEEQGRARGLRDSPEVTGYRQVRAGLAVLNRRLGGRRCALRTTESKARCAFRFVANLLHCSVPISCFCTRILTANFRMTAEGAESTERFAEGFWNTALRSPFKLNLAFRFDWSRSASLCDPLIFLCAFAVAFLPLSGFAALVPFECLPPQTPFGLAARVVSLRSAAPVCRHLLAEWPLQACHVPIQLRFGCAGPRGSLLGLSGSAAPRHLRFLFRILAQGKNRADLASVR